MPSKEYALRSWSRPFNNACRRAIASPLQKNCIS
jgi:hypothetical protein